jgi:hypothetical protein
LSEFRLSNTPRELIRHASRGHRPSRRHLVRAITVYGWFGLIFYTAVVASIVFIRRTAITGFVAPSLDAFFGHRISLKVWCAPGTDRLDAGTLVVISPTVRPHRCGGPIAYLLLTGEGKPEYPNTRTDLERLP